MSMVVSGIPLNHLYIAFWGGVICYLTTLYGNLKQPLIHAGLSIGHMFFCRSICHIPMALQLPQCLDLLGVEKLSS